MLEMYNILKKSFCLIVIVLLVLFQSNKSLLNNNKLPNKFNIIRCINVNKVFEIRSSNQIENSNRIGSVTLVGSGPGDPDLLTIQAYRILKSASLVVSDRLVSTEILDIIDCEIKVANKKPGCAEEAQDEINKWVIDAALKGRNVVRLKIGDPFLFGRGGEEILEYRKHGIHATVTPGLSSSYSAPLSASIPITHRGVANQVIICTGYGQNGVTVDVPEYKPDRTVVLLMAVGRIGQISDEMIKLQGYPEEMPVSIIENATTPKQRILTGTLKTINDIAIKEQAKPPAVIVIGYANNVLN